MLCIDPQPMPGILDDILDVIKVPVYTSAMYLIYAAYIATLFGIVYVDPTQINKLNVFVQLFVGLFLFYRFHPFRSHELRKYDSQLIFGSAVFLLANLGITQYILQKVVPNAILPNTSLRITDI